MRDLVDTVSSDKKDRKIIIEALSKAKVFSFEKGRCHSTFRNIKVNLIQGMLHHKNLDQWMRKHLNALKNAMF